MHIAAQSKIIPQFLYILRNGHFIFVIMTFMNHKHIIMILYLLTFTVIIIKNHEKKKNIPQFFHCYIFNYLFIIKISDVHLWIQNPCEYLISKISFLHYTLNLILKKKIWIFRINSELDSTFISSQGSVKTKKVVDESQNLKKLCVSMKKL